MKPVTVTAYTGETWRTDINGTNDKIAKYFINQNFNIGRIDDHVVKIGKLEIREFCPNISYFDIESGDCQPTPGYWKIDREKRKICTYTEGDLYTVYYGDNSHFEGEIRRQYKFYTEEF